MQRQMAKQQTILLFLLLSLLLPLLLCLPLLLLLLWCPCEKPACEQVRLWQLSYKWGDIDTDTPSSIHYSHPVHTHAHAWRAAG